MMYGRDDEARVLCNAYELCFGEKSSNPNQHIVFVHGPSGCGKTALATQTLRPLLSQQNGLFLTGKADATAQWSHPYGVFVSAFQQLILLAQDDRRKSGLEQVRDAIVKEFGGDCEGSNDSDDALLLSSIIPGFEKLIVRTRLSAGGYTGRSSSLSSDNGIDSVARLRFLLGRLCRTIANQCPFVLFLDDIQWCDAASLQLLTSIVSPSIATINSRGSPLMVVCAYRDDEEYHLPPPASHTSRAHEMWSEGPPLVEFLRYWKNFSSTTNCYRLGVHEIQLRNVDEATLHKVLSGVFGLPQMEFYSQLIYKVSSGNIFVALQCVRQLCEEGLLYRCEATNEWKWDFSQLQAQDDATAQFLLNPAFSDIVRHSLIQLTEPTRHLLSVASCFGMEIEKDVLTLLFRGESDLVQSVEKSLEEGTEEGLLVLDPIVGQHAFAHDRVQQAAHALISDVDALSFKVGYKLWQQCTPLMLREKIFAVVTLLNKGQSEDNEGRLVRDLLPQHDWYAVARLNLEAGEKALTIAAFSDATKYLERGVSLLMRAGKDGTYWRDEYALSLDLLSAAAEVQVVNENFERADKLIAELCTKANCLDDKYRAMLARINATGLQGQIQEAINIGVGFLHQLGEKMPSRATIPVLLTELVHTEVALWRKSNSFLTTLPAMEDKKKIAATVIIKALFTFTLVTQSDYTVVLATKSIRLCLKHGTFERSSTSFTMYGFALCGLGNVEKGFRYGDLGMSLLERHQSRDLLPCVHVLFYYGVHHRKRPLREGIEGLKKGIRVGYEVGDIESAMGCENVMVHHSWFMGCRLREVDLLIRSGLSQQKVQDHPVTHDFLQVLLHTVDRLTGRTPYVGVLEFTCALRSITFIDEDSHREEFNDEEDGSNEVDRLKEDLREKDLRSASTYHHGALLAYIFREYQSAHAMVVKYNPGLRKLAMSTTGLLQLEWIDALISVAMAREEGKGSRKLHLSNAKRIMKRMAKRAQECPSNCAHMYNSIAAEYKSMAVGTNSNSEGSRKTFVLVEQAYSSAIAKASQEGFLHVAAVAAERAGDFMLRMHNTNAAQLYWEKAHSFYLEWGALAKATSLATLKSSAPPAQASLLSEQTAAQCNTKPLRTRSIVLRTLSKRFSRRRQVTIKRRLSL